MDKRELPRNLPDDSLQNVTEFQPIQKDRRALNNYLRRDRLQATVMLNEPAQLGLGWFRLLNLRVVNAIIRGNPFTEREKEQMQQGNIDKGER
jgi:hypothetical protein